MKKDEARFTIRFNPADPRHKIAMNTLHAAGRRKSTLIADALVSYLSRHGCYIGTDPLYSLPSMLSCKFSSPVGKSHPESRPTTEVIENNMSATDDQYFDDDMKSVVLSGLNTFIH